MASLQEIHINYSKKSQSSLLTRLELSRSHSAALTGKKKNPPLVFFLTLQNPNLFILLYLVLCQGPQHSLHASVTHSYDSYISERVL